MKKLIYIVIILFNHILIAYGQETAGVSIAFRVYDNAGGERTLYLGLDQTASDTIDFHLGESNLPPSPPIGAFDARWILPKNGFNGSLSSWLDYRYVNEFPFTDTIEHRIKYQAKTGADTMFFSWDFPAEATGLLQDLITGIIINMPLSNSGVFPITNFTIVNQLKLTMYYDVIIPVELISFSANVVGQSIKLNWTTATEINNAGFEIERASLNRFEETLGMWGKIGYVTGSGTSAEIKTYSFIDNNVSSGNYLYRLKQIDYDGTFEYSNEVEVDISAPQEFTLHQNYPNPFNASTIISWQLVVRSWVTLKIYDVLGQEIATLVNGSLDAGVHNFLFNASSLNSGMYFYTIEVSGINKSNFTSTKKMLTIK